MTVQAKHLYPQIAQSAAYREQLQLFLRSLNERNFQFTRWKDYQKGNHTGLTCNDLRSCKQCMPIVVCREV